MSQDDAQHIDRFQRGMDRMMELVSTEQSGTFDHAKLVDSYKDLDPELSDYILSFAFGDIYSRTSLTQQEQTMVTIATLAGLDIEPQLKLHINVGFNVGLTAHPGPPSQAAADQQGFPLRLVTRREAGTRRASSGDGSRTPCSFPARLRSCQVPRGGRSGGEAVVRRTSAKSSTGRAQGASQPRSGREPPNESSP